MAPLSENSITLNSMKPMPARTLPRAGVVIGSLGVVRVGSNLYVIVARMERSGMRDNGSRITLRSIRATSVHDEIPRPGQGVRALGRRRQRLRCVPAREVHRGHL